MSKKQIEISTLRVTAMFMVFVSHTGGPWPEKFFKYVTLCAPNGVALFFVISGYCACLGENKNALAYYKKRCLRICPIYWVTYHINVFLRCFVCRMLTFDIGRYFIGLLGLQMMIPSREYGWNGIGATGPISTFIIFYLLTPLLRQLIRDKKTAEIYLGIVASICMINRILMVKILPLMCVWGGGSIKWLPFFSPQTNLVYPMIGIWAYYIKKDGASCREIVILLLANLFGWGWWLHAGDGYLFFSIMTVSVLLVYWKIDSSFMDNGLYRSVIYSLDEISYAFWLTHPIVLTIIEILQISVNWWILLSICLVMADVFTRLGKATIRIGRIENV